MERMRCPSCGAPYNGKKCRACLYVPTETNLSRSTKTAPVIPGQKRKKSTFSSLAGLFVILAIIAMVMPGLRSWGWKLDAIDAANRTPEPIPGNPTVLFQQEPITVLVPKKDSPDVSLWFYNHGKEDVIVVCKDITINGYRMENAAVSVYVPSDSAVKTTLAELDTFAAEITFVMDAKTPAGEFLFETPPIYLQERTVLYG